MYARAVPGCLLGGGGLPKCVITAARAKSFLGPILFLIYINDLPCSSSDEHGRPKSLM